MVQKVCDRTHQTPELVLWMFAHGIMPLSTPLSRSWLNMAESIQRIRKRRRSKANIPRRPKRLLPYWKRPCRGSIKNRPRLYGVASGPCGAPRVGCGDIGWASLGPVSHVRCVAFLL